MPPVPNSSPFRRIRLYTATVAITKYFETFSLTWTAISDGDGARVRPVVVVARRCADVWRGAAAGGGTGSPAISRTAAS